MFGSRDDGDDYSRLLRQMDNLCFVSGISFGRYRSFRGSILMRCTFDPRIALDDRTTSASVLEMSPSTFALSPRAPFLC